ncbi:MAG: hypothetical protein CSA09_02125 [Candidatus Contendobacter odensis]|uniref:FHA domain-containing protein n=1 Tax=Candidatus Contendibacter odensensis TaxID=1400860 RepID=A0A2G6PFF0_9GAMM|nr:MAG: hypothetical protein CSA09_02125 [Candidatus Contendobacter odensis]
MTTHSDALVASDYIVCATLRKVADVFNVELLWERIRSGQDGVFLAEALKRRPRTARTRQRKETYYSHVIVRIPERDYLRDDRLEDGFARNALQEDLVLLHEQHLAQYLDDDMEVRYQVEPDTGLRVGEVRFLFGRGIYIPACDESPAFRIQVAGKDKDSWRTVGIIYPGQRLTLLNGNRRSSTFAIGGWPFLGGQSVLLVQRADDSGSVDVVAEPPSGLILDCGSDGEVMVSDHRGRGLWLRVVALSTEMESSAYWLSTVPKPAKSLLPPDEGTLAVEPEIEPVALETDTGIGVDTQSGHVVAEEPYTGVDHRGRREPVLGMPVNVGRPPEADAMEPLPSSEWPSPPPTPATIAFERPWPDVTMAASEPSPPEAHLHIVGIALQRLSVYEAAGIRDWRIHFDPAGAVVPGHHANAVVRLRIDSSDRVFGEIQEQSTLLNVPSVWQPLTGLALTLQAVPVPMADHYLGWVHLPAPLDLSIRCERDFSFGRGSEADIAPRLLADPQALRWRNVESSGGAGINAEYLGLSRCHLRLQARQGNWHVALESHNMPTYRLSPSGDHLDILTPDTHTRLIARVGELLVVGGYVLSLGSMAAP